jgi:hypothetical protein
LARRRLQVWSRSVQQYGEARPLEGKRPLRLQHDPHQSTFQGTYSLQSTGTALRGDLALSRADYTAVLVDCE